MPGDGGVGPRELDDAGFRAEDLTSTAGIPHDAVWADRLAYVLGG